MGTVFEELERVLGAYARVARSPAFFPLWLGRLVSNFGDTLHYLALVVLVFQLTGQGVGVAGLVAAEIVPAVLLGPVAGVIVDRFSRKAVLVGSDILRAVLALSLVWPQGAWHAYLVAAGMSAAAAFFNPTLQAVIPALTSDEERLAANSVSFSTGRLVQILASALAGGLIVWIGTGPAFLVNGLTFLVSASLIATLAIRAHAGQVDTEARRGLGAYLSDAREGVRYALSDRFLSSLVLVQSLASLAIGATSAMLVVLAERHLGLPPAGFAWLIGAIGVGALLGPLIPNALARDYHDARWLFIPYVIRGAGDVLLATFTPLPLALVIMFVYGLNASAGLVVFNSALQGTVPDAVRGRVFALLDLSWNVARLLSLALGGLIVDQVGIRPLFWAGGALLALAGLLGLALQRPARRESVGSPSAS